MSQVGKDHLIAKEENIRAEADQIPHAVAVRLGNQKLNRKAPRVPHHLGGPLGMDVRGEAHKDVGLSTGAAQKARPRQQRQVTIRLKDAVRARAASVNNTLGFRRAIFSNDRVSCASWGPRGPTDKLLRSSLTRVPKSLVSGPFQVAYGHPVAAEVVDTTATATATVAST